MKNPTGKKHTPSLAQHFEAPADHTGQFAWLCGYSADAGFLNNAMDRFTRTVMAQRAQQGQISLALMLDPGNAPLTLPDVPGVAHLPLRDVAQKPFALLHAKVALLGFRHLEDAARWRIRLLVSTGNWTCQTLEESLDFAWRVDITSDDLLAGSQGLAQQCADVGAAAGLLEWLAGLSDQRLLDASARDGAVTAADARHRLAEWLASCREKAGGASPRFFDSREASLLKQLPQLVTLHADKVRRNYVAMGSGFFESPRGADPHALVIDDILAMLREEGLLTQTAETDVFVNPLACQAIAASATALSKRGIRVRAPAQPESVFGNANTRTLHAKFIFSAGWREGSDRCTNAWAYLGSGNLTGPGFTQAMKRASGNLEAGVVFSAGVPDWSDVAERLALQWDTVVEPGPLLEAGDDMPERDVLFEAAPIGWLRWCEVNGEGELQIPGELPAAALDAFDVLDAQGLAVTRTSTGFAWPAPCPRQATVQWGPAQRAPVAVVDEFGRVAATPLRPLDVVDAWWQLARFPLAPEDEGVDLNDGGPGEGDGATPHAGATPDVAYPGRQMMELVENIAAKQTKVAQPDWSAWCNRLEQTLVQASKSPVLAAFREIGLDPLSPLRAAPFRPVFAEDGRTTEGALYESTLTRIATQWKVTGLDKMHQTAPQGEAA